MTAAKRGQRALITGSTSGIGLAIAQRLSTEGVHVVLCGRDEIRGSHAINHIRSLGGRADFVATSLHTAIDAHELGTRAEAILGGIDILINNAGIYGFGLTSETTEAAFDDTYAINVKVPYFLVAQLAPLMATRGSGCVVNVVTGAAYKGSPVNGLYGSSKAALILLTKSWAAEYGPAGVRVNAVSPGSVLTPGTAHMREALNALTAGIPAQRLGQLGEIADAVSFLVSEQASYIQGAVLPVDGGFIAT